MKKTNLLLSAALGVLVSHDFLRSMPSFETSGNPKRFKHLSEVEAEKREAKRREIAEWNARIGKEKS